MPSSASRPAGPTGTTGLSFWVSGLLRQCCALSGRRHTWVRAALQGSNALHLHTSTQMPSLHVSSPLATAPPSTPSEPPSLWVVLMHSLTPVETCGGRQDTFLTNSESVQRSTFKTHVSRVHFLTGAFRVTPTDHDVSSTGRFSRDRGATGHPRGGSATAPAYTASQPCLTLAKSMAFFLPEALNGR